MLASPSDQSRADSLQLSCFLASFLGKMAVFDKTEPLRVRVTHPPCVASGCSVLQWNLQDMSLLTTWPHLLLKITTHFVGDYITAHFLSNGTILTSMIVQSWRLSLQHVAACCSMIPRVAACCSVLQRVAACCILLQRVAACCSRPLVGMFKYLIAIFQRRRLIFSCCALMTSSIAD